MSEPFLKVPALIAGDLGALKDYLRAWGKQKKGTYWWDEEAVAYHFALALCTYIDDAEVLALSPIQLDVRDGVHRISPQPAGIG